MSEMIWAPFAQGGIDRRVIEGGAAYRQLENARAAAGDVVCSVAVLGAFDGLHLGHQALVRASVADAQRRGVRCVAVTFAPDPDEVVGVPAPSRRLLSTQDRVAGLLGLGIDEVVVLDFTPRLAARTPEEFVRDTLLPLTRPVAVHVGKNFRFGRGGQGDVGLLRALGARHGFEVEGHDLVVSEGVRVSSTRVRDLLLAGDLDRANRLLGRCHFLRGEVSHGRGEGTSFGFPTANVEFERADCLPAEGVYACYVTCGGKAWPAAANVGAPPTFSSPRPAFLEANLIGFAGDLYGERVGVSFVRWLRASRVFDSLEELEATVLGNIDWVRSNLGDAELEVRA